MKRTPLLFVAILALAAAGPAVADDLDAFDDATPQVVSQSALDAALATAAEEAAAPLSPEEGGFETVIVEKVAPAPAAAKSLVAAAPAAAPASPLAAALSRLEAATVTAAAQLAAATSELAAAAVAEPADVAQAGTEAPAYRLAEAVAAAPATAAALRRFAAQAEQANGYAGPPARGPPGNGGGPGWGVALGQLLGGLAGTAYRPGYGAAAPTCPACTYFSPQAQACLQSNDWTCRGYGYGRKLML
jgi:hypothetical protein